MNEFAQTGIGGRFLRILTALFAIGILYMIILSVNEWKSGDYVSGGYQNTITVSGEGEVFAKPDVATFSFTVNEEGATVADAQEKATEKTNKAIDAVKQGGVDEKDIKTLGYNINPKYEYYYQAQPLCTSTYCPPTSARNQKVVGYEVSQTIEVKVRDLEKAGGLLTSIGSIGVSNVSGLSFSIDDQTALEAEAREMAIDEAKEKAKALARDLDVSIVRVVSFNESGNYPVYYGYGKGGDVALSEASVAPSIPSGENRIVSNVTITYEIR